ncbi:MAG: GAF domain-containing protein [Gemmatimonadetes bacterium]|nr:GAF domain-containing protein [Gemmatimonadota bacterium]MDA1103869.1 GAF domain-containing protein [Gemmatimonadota bacterium]
MTVEGTIEELKAELEFSRWSLREMSKVGMALMGERDPLSLFDLILSQSRSLTGSDAGSLYLVEKGEDGSPLLHFIASQTDTLPEIPSPTFRLPLNEHSIAGYAATNGRPLVLEDVYELPDNVPFSFNRAVYDEKYGYRAKSMLVVPMIDHRDNVVGVLQLINRKSDRSAKIRTDEDSDRWVLPYTDREVEIVSSLAGQAAVAIENGRLYQDIENLFAGFIKAAVTAIDRRDPTTSGHSVRVTELTCDVANLINEQTEGPFADSFFTDAEMKQLRYAGLLHDFGKVGVREETLVKQNKLSPVLGAQVEARFVLIRITLRLQAAEARAAAIAEKGPEGAAEDIAAIDAQLQVELEKADRYWAAVQEANVPRVLDEDAAEILQEISRTVFVDPDGNQQTFLTPHELHFLEIRRGSLDESERLQIQSHVVHSYDFLLNIPWTEELSRIAEIVRGHHEKLDGSGYPDGVTGDTLSLETRIMTVCDIFDALTASDRPYKKAMPVEKAIQILQWEAKDGMLDQDIVDLFAASEVYRKVLDGDWREF